VSSENFGRSLSGNYGRSPSDEAMSVSDATKRPKRGKDVRDAQKT
jgi:hypothetical protein